VNHNDKVKSRYLEGTRQLCSALNVCWPRRGIPARCSCRTLPWPCKSAAPTPSSSCSRPWPTAARRDWRRPISVPSRPQGCEAGQRRWVVGRHRRGRHRRRADGVRRRWVEEERRRGLVRSRRAERGRTGGASVGREETERMGARKLKPHLVWVSSRAAKPIELVRWWAGPVSLNGGGQARWAYLSAHRTLCTE